MTKPYPSTSIKPHNMKTYGKWRYRSTSSLRIASLIFSCFSAQLFMKNRKFQWIIKIFKVVFLLVYRAYMYVYLVLCVESWLYRQNFSCKEVPRYEDAWESGGKVAHIFKASTRWTWAMNVRFRLLSTSLRIRYEAGSRPNTNHQAAAERIIPASARNPT
jgi:hypothetical protein